RAAAQLQGTTRHGGLEAAPMGRPQPFGDDQVETLTERLLGPVPEQFGGRRVPAPDRPRAVRVDHGISDVREDRFGQGRRIFHVPVVVSLDRHGRKISRLPSITHASAGSLKTAAAVATTNRVTTSGSTGAYSGA